MNAIEGLSVSWIHTKLYYTPLILKGWNEENRNVRALICVSRNRV